MAASDSSARSAITVCISGWCASGAPNALRWATWCAASDSAARISDAEPSTQSSRVIDTISMIVATPRPSAPSRQPTAPSYSISADALDRLPSLSLRRMQPDAVAGAVGQHPGEDEAGEPVRRLRQREEQVVHRGRGEPLVAGEPVGAVARRLRARGVRPHVRAALLLGHRHAREQPGLRRRAGEAERVGRGAQAAARTPRPAPGRAAARARPRTSSRSGSSAPTPAAPSGRSRRPAPRARPARRRPPTARPCSPEPTARRISQCQDGWNSTSSMRVP